MRDRLMVQDINQFDFSKNWQRSDIPEQATWDLTALLYQMKLGKKLSLN